MSVTGEKFAVNHSDLQVIIALGFKIDNEKAIAFRKWANQIVSEYTIKGWVINELDIPYPLAFLRCAILSQSIVSPLRTAGGFGAHQSMLCCAPKHALLRTKTFSAAQRPIPMRQVCQNDTLKSVAIGSHPQLCDITKKVFSVDENGA